MWLGPWPRCRPGERGGVDLGAKNPENQLEGVASRECFQVWKEGRREE